MRMTHGKMINLRRVKMISTWYVGERISTHCIYCSERLQTFITNPNGNHSRTMHIKCEKEMRDIEA